MEAVFPSIFSQTYNSDIYFLRSTQEQRAMMSADSFSYGFLEGKGFLIFLFLFFETKL